MDRFSLEKLIILEKCIYEVTGQIIITRDYKLLDSAIESIYQTFDSIELYPSLEEKAARLCFNLINNHPFVDGNKRVGVLAMLCYLEINNVYINCTNEELINIGLSLASGKMKYKQLVQWINDRKFNKRNDEIIK